MKKLHHTRIWRAASLRTGGTVAAAVIALTACFGDSPEQMLASAKSHLDKRDNKSAIIQLKNVLQKNASLPEARFLLGKALLDSGDVAGAAIELSKARELGYPTDEVAPLLANAMLLKGEADKVIAEYSQVELQSPQRNAQLKATLASAYAVKGRMAQARESVDVALKLDPDNIAAHMADVRLLSADKKYDAALQALEQLLKANPKLSPGWQLKAEILLNSQRGNDAALAAYQEAIKQDPGNLGAYAGVIGVHMQQRDLDAAQKAFDILRAQYPNHPQTFYYATLLALDRKDLKQAHEQSQAMLKAMPVNPAALHLAGVVAFQRGSYLEAQSHLGKALQATPDRVAIRQLLSRAFLRGGDPAKALSTIQPLLEGAETTAESFSIAAEANLQLGNNKAAEQLFARAVKLNPQDARGRTALALSQLRAGNGAEGVEELRNISAGDSGATADLALISTYMSQSKHDQALAAIEALERKPNYKVVAAVLRGRVEMARGQRAKAREAYEAAMKLAPNSTPAAVALGNMDMEDRKPQLAIQRFDKLLEVDPKNVEARLAAIGFRAQAGASKEEIIGLIDKAIKLHPDDAGPRIALASTYLQNQQIKQALTAAEEGVAAFPNSVRLHDVLGRAQIAAGDFNQAIQSFNKMASLEPNSTDPMMRLAELYKARKDAPGVISSLKKAIALKADYLPAQADLTGMLLGTGKIDEARAVARTVQSQRPNHPVGWTLEGDVEYVQKRWPEAVAAYRTSLKKEETTEAAAKLFRALDVSGKPDEARKLEDAWLAKHPGDAFFLFQVAEMALGQGDYAHAEKRFLDLIKVQPNNAIALNNLAWLFLRNGKPEALEYAERAVKLRPNTTAFLDTLASVHAGAKRYDKAIELQKNAVELDSSQHLHRLHLAQYYAAAGFKTEARAELKQLVGLGNKQFPQQAEAQKLLATLE